MKKGDLGPVLVNIGFGNAVTASKVVAIVTPGSAPMKRFREEARKQGKLVDATEGRRTRSIIVTDSDHIILSALQVETITQRFFVGDSELPGKGKTETDEEEE
ncbi:MAG: DUF370 domain-containing protein [Nitrospirae bacterium]|nr:DUF370 domain-containing protein [Nitrospirota bacterium]OIO31680.1 MAG: hypothetical protein AUJ60_01135 [Nitrospirae bacterium CG1_02_44_142]